MYRIVGEKYIPSHTIGHQPKYSKYLDILTAECLWYSYHDHLAILLFEVNFKTLTFRLFLFLLVIRKFNEKIKKLPPYSIKYTDQMQFGI